MLLNWYRILKKTQLVYCECVRIFDSFKNYNKSIINNKR